MAASVATPLEKQFTRIAGVTEMTSSSSLGSANVTLQFDLSRDINAAARDVQAAINAAAAISARQPAHQSALPQSQSGGRADSDHVAAIGRGADAGAVRHRVFGFRAEAVAGQGVGQVNVDGSSLPAVRVEVNPQPVSSYNVGMDQIGSFLQGANANTAQRRTDRRRHDAAALDHGSALSRPKITRIWSSVYRNNAPVRLSDLGRVIDSVEDVRNMGLANGKPAVLIQISRQPNANIIDTVDRVKALLPQFQASLPPTVHSEYR